MGSRAAAAVRRLENRIAAARWRDLAALTACAVAIGAVAGVAGLYPIAFVLGLAPFTVIAWRSAPAALVLIALTSPVVAVGSLSVGFHLIPCYLFIAAAALGVLRRRALRSFEPRAHDWLLLAFLLVAGTITLANAAVEPNTTVLGAIGANAPGIRSAAQFVALAAMGVLYFVVRIEARSAERLYAVVRALIVAAAFVALYAAYQILGRKLGLPCTDLDNRRSAASLKAAGGLLRTNSTLPEASPLAEFMLIVLFLAIGWLLTPPARPSWLPAKAPAWMAVASGAVVAATLSAAAWIACAIWVPLMVLVRTRGRGRRIALGLAGLAGMFGLALLLLSLTSGGVRGFLESQRYVRVGYWIAGVKMVAAHPLGVGVGNYGFYYPLYAPLSGRYEYQVGISDAHNLFLDAAAETGVAGALLLIGFFGLLVSRAIRRATRSGTLGELETIALSLAAALGAGLTMHLTFSYAYYPFEWLVAGLVGSVPALIASRATAPEPDPAGG